MNLTKWIVIGAAWLGAGVSEAATISLDKSTNLTVTESGKILYADWPMISVSTNLELPARELLVELESGQTVSQISVGRQTIERCGHLPVNISPYDSPTSLDPDLAQLAHLLSDSRLGSQPVYFMGETTVNSRRFARALMFPVTVDTNGELFFCDSVTLLMEQQSVEPERVTIPPNGLVSSDNIAGSMNPERGASTSAADFVIVTSESLAESFRPLAAYKAQTGYRTEIKLIELICSSYTGRDNAEKLREYLKQFYAEGGRYALLGGDETVVPIRYAYHGDADTAVDPSLLQVADLYFADLTGNWNRDNDPVWGERTDDAPDLTPEIIVGRLPVNAADEVRNYVTKLIGYETNPGNGDPSYLNRAFFFSSDQMRDYTPFTQHEYIAKGYPSAMTVDTVTGVEAMRGDDPAPSNLAPSAMGAALNQGFGIINVIAHGRDDGFAVKTSGYNEGMRAMLWTNEVSGESGSFAALQAPDRPAFYYSLACDNGAFDKSSPPFNFGTRNMAQELIGEPDGAVGMVAYSRWGWIGTSYILQRVFFDSLFAHPDRLASVAMYACKARFPYYRDLVLGQNYLGDPTVVVYASAPARQTVQTAYASGMLSVIVLANGQPSIGAKVILTDSTGEIAVSLTAENGRAQFALPANLDRAVCVSATKTGCTVGQTWYYQSIVTDVDESDQSLPAEFALLQNYPNPFNPSTRINFALPTSGRTTLTVYDLLGREVKTLVDGVLSAGNHVTVWYGTDDRGNEVAAGVYFYRLTSNSNTVTKKMLLLK